MSTLYQKIQNIYKRDPQTKKIIEKEFTSKELDYLKDNLWEGTEKVDGTNIRVIWDGFRVSFGGRTDKAEIPTPLATKLNQMFSGSEIEQLFEQKFGEKNVILFGEGFGPKIQKSGGTYRKENDFILFDVMINDKYLSRDNVEDVAAYFGIQCVPVVFRGTLQEAVDFVKTNPESKVATNGKMTMEGIVVKPAVELCDSKGERIIVKIKCCDYNK